MALTPNCSVYGPELIVDQTGTPLPSQSVTVYQADGVTAAHLYTDITGTTTLSSSGLTTTDSYGNLTFFVASPGKYVISTTIAGVVTTITVFLAPSPFQLADTEWSTTPLFGTVPANPAFWWQTWEDTISVGGTGYALDYAIPLAYPNALCAAWVTPLGSTTGPTIYVVNLYPTGSHYSLSTLSFIAGRIDGSGVTHFPDGGGLTIRMTFKTLGC